MSPSGSNNIPKDEFPSLLKQLMVAKEPNMKKDMQSGFRKTGIVPFIKQEVIGRLPSATAENSLAKLTDCVGNTFLDKLQKRRQEVTNINKKRRKQLNVPSEKSISSGDVEKSLEEIAAMERQKQKSKRN